MTRPRLNSLQRCARLAHGMRLPARHAAGMAKTAMTAASTATSKRMAEVAANGQFRSVDRLLLDIRSA